MATGIHGERYQAAIEALRAARKASGVSQAALAKKLGRWQQYVSKYESGERRLDIIEFLDAATALGVDWTALLQELSES